MKKHHDIGDVRFEGGSLVLTIDGKERTFQLKEISPLLQKASYQERNVFEISPSGYGIHWPLLDEDISIDGLLGIPHAPEWKQKTAWAKMKPVSSRTILMARTRPFPNSGIS